jgi:hypothetical protein
MLWVCVFTWLDIKHDNWPIFDFSAKQNYYSSWKVGLKTELLGIENNA